MRRWSGGHLLACKNCTSESGDSGQHALRQLLEHHAIAGDGKMIVAEDVQMFVPILVAIGCGKEHWKEIDECLAMGGTEILPQLDLSAVAIVLRDLLRPRIDHDGQGNAAALEE